jgi:hypothetical protein
VTAYGADLSYGLLSKLSVKTLLSDNPDIESIRSSYNKALEIKNRVFVNDLREIVSQIEQIRQRLQDLASSKLFQLIQRSYKAMKGVADMVKNDFVTILEKIQAFNDKYEEEYAEVNNIFLTSWKSLHARIQVFLLNCFSQFHLSTIPQHVDIKIVGNFRRIYVLGRNINSPGPEGSQKY